MVWQPISVICCEFSGALPPEPLTRGSAPGPRWGTSIPRFPLPPTSKSWLRHWCWRPVFAAHLHKRSVHTTRGYGPSTLVYGLVALNMLIVSAEAGGEKAKCRCAIKRQRMDCGGAKDSNQYLGSDDSSLSNSDRRSDSNLFSSSNRIYRFRFGKNRG